MSLPNCSNDHTAVLSTPSFKHMEAAASQEHSPISCADRILQAAWGGDRRGDSHWGAEPPLTWGPGFFVDSLACLCRPWLSRVFLPARLRAILFMSVWILEEEVRLKWTCKQPIHEQVACSANNEKWQGNPAGFIYDLLPLLAPGRNAFLTRTILLEFGAALRNPTEPPGAPKLALGQLRTDCKAGPSTSFLCSLV